MFLTLLATTLLVSLLICFLVVRIFTRPIDSILQRIIADSISSAWTRYLRFAIYVTGVSSGVNLRSIERYIIAPEHRDSELAVGLEPLVLTSERLVLELYRTIVETLQGVAWMLLVFFVFALIAYVIVRGLELFQAKRNP